MSNTRACNKLVTSERRKYLFISARASYLPVSEIHCTSRSTYNKLKRGILQHFYIHVSLNMLLYGSNQC